VANLLSWELRQSPHPLGNSIQFHSFRSDPEELERLAPTLPLSGLLSMSRTDRPVICPVGIPIRACGYLSHHARICAASVAACLDPPWRGIGLFSPLHGNTRLPRAAYASACSSIISPPWPRLLYWILARRA